MHPEETTPIKDDIEIADKRPGRFAERSVESRYKPETVIRNFHQAAEYLLNQDINQLSPEEQYFRTMLESQIPLVSMDNIDSNWTREIKIDKHNEPGQIIRSEGVRIDGLIAYLTKLRTHTTDARERAKITRLINSLNSHSLPYAEVYPNENPSEASARKAHEAMIISTEQNPLNQGNNEEANWLEGEKQLSRSRELVLPRKPEKSTVKNRKNSDTQAVTQDESDKQPTEKPSEAEISDINSPSESSTITQVSPEDNQRPPITRVFEGSIYSNQFQAGTSADLYADRRTAESLATPSRLRNIPRKIWNMFRRWGEGGINQRYMRDALRAINQTGIANADIARAVQEGQINAQQAHLEAQVQDQATIDRMSRPEGVDIGETRIKLADGALKNALIGQIITPIALGEISDTYDNQGNIIRTARQELQNRLRDFIAQNQNNPDFTPEDRTQLQQLFGRSQDRYGTNTAVFATDLLKMGQEMREALKTTDNNLEHLSQAIEANKQNIVLWIGRVQEGAQTDLRSNLDRVVAWLRKNGFNDEQASHTGGVASVLLGIATNPVVIGVFGTLGTKMGLSILSGGARAITATSVANAGMGLVVGSAMAGIAGGLRAHFEMGNDLKRDDVEHTYGRPETTRQDIDQSLDQHGGLVGRIARMPGIRRFSGVDKTAEMSDVRFNKINVLDLTNQLRQAIANQDTNQILQLYTQYEAANRVMHQAGVDQFRFSSEQTAQQERSDLRRVALDARNILHSTYGDQVEQQIENQSAVYSQEIRQTQDRRAERRRTEAIKKGLIAATTGLTGGAIGLAAQELWPTDSAPPEIHTDEIIRPKPSLELINKVAALGGNLEENQTQIYGGVPEDLRLELEEAGYQINPLPAVESVQPVELLKPQGLIEAQLDGTNIRIPDGSHLIANDKGSFDLVVDNPLSAQLPEGMIATPDGKPILATNITLNPDGSFNTTDMQVFKLNLEQEDGSLLASDMVELVAHPKPDILLTGDQAIERWAELGTPIKETQWYANNTRYSDGSELQLYTLKDGQTVLLDMKSMVESTQRGLTPEIVNIKNIIDQGKAVWAIRLPGMENNPLIIPDNADGFADGYLKLDPDDIHHTVTMGNGEKMTISELSKMLVDYNRLNQLKDGNIATEYYNLQDLFKIGRDGQMGLISAGTMVEQPDGSKIFQSFATIRGSGAPSMWESGGFESEIHLNHPLNGEVSKQIPVDSIVAKETIIPVPTPEQNKEYFALPTPIAPRNPVEYPGQKKEAPPPPPEKPKPPIETPPISQSPETSPTRPPLTKQELAELAQLLVNKAFLNDEEKKRRLDELLGRSEITNSPSQTLENNQPNPTQIEKLTSQEATELNELLIKRSHLDLKQQKRLDQLLKKQGTGSEAPQILQDTQTNEDLLASQSDNNSTNKLTSSENNQPITDQTTSQDGSLKSSASENNDLVENSDALQQELKDYGQSYWDADYISNELPKEARALSQQLINLGDKNNLKSETLLYYNALTSLYKAISGKEFDPTDNPLTNTDFKYPNRSIEQINTDRLKHYQVLYRK